eukprot:1236451-Heterocapsa_arctica.AAC.1
MAPDIGHVSRAGPGGAPVHISVQEVRASAGEKSLACATMDDQPGWQTMVRGRGSACGSNLTRTSRTVSGIPGTG